MIKKGEAEMAEKKKTAKKVDKAPSLRERITDTSVGGHSKPIFIPKKKK